MSVFVCESVGVCVGVCLNLCVSLMCLGWKDCELLTILECKYKLTANSSSEDLSFVSGSSES